MPDQQKLTTRKEEDDERKPKPEQQASTYPISPGEQAVFQQMGITYADDEMGRAWCRMFDRGFNLGPATAAKTVGGPNRPETMYFLYGVGSRDISPSNINKKVVFTHNGNIIGEESGL